VRHYDYRSGAIPVGADPRVCPNGDGLPLSTNLYDTEKMVP
jgi:hypothetical protein